MFVAGGFSVGAVVVPNDFGRNFHILRHAAFS